MSSYQEWKDRLALLWDEVAQNGALQLAGVGAFMLSALIGFKYYNQLRGPTFLRIQEIHDSVLKNLEKA
jgi:hypothetical protein